ncbi:MAG TPA: hypothetical protein VIY90_05350 [Steroidobacteraceae bacterium]
MQSAASAVQARTDNTVLGHSHADHRFFSAMAIAASIAILAGFSRSYFIKAFTLAPPLPLFVHVHAALFASWLLLFVTQTLLAARKRLTLHRRLGVAGAILAVLLVVGGVATAIVAARAGYRGVPGQEARDPQIFLIVPLRDITLFAIFAAAGLGLRRKPQIHKRLMLLAVTGALMPAGVSRLPGMSHFPPLIGITLLLFLLACPVYDFVRQRRLYASYLSGALLSALLFAPMTERLASSPTWVRFADWLIR